MSKQIPKPSIQLTESEQFFYEHAGYAYDPKVETRAQGRTRCAINLAAAERWADEQGVYAEWIIEPEPDLSWCGDCGTEHTPEEHATETYACSLRDRDGEVIASLGNIDRPSDEYKRVVRAELASEVWS